MVRSLPGRPNRPGWLWEEWSLAGLAARPPFSGGRTRLLGAPVSYTHPQSYVAQYREIFQNEGYGFGCDRADPLIVDCGANIGLATIYWKHRYPAAHVICFEPDPDICAVLRSNLAARGLDDVEVRQAAVWSASGSRGFTVLGAGGGRLDGGDLSVRTVRLADEIVARTAGREIDLLKLDIEGAESEVLPDCSDHLAGVRRVFVEYHETGCGPDGPGPILALLSGAGYQLSIRHEIAPLAPFLGSDRSRPSMQLNIWAWRSPRR